jgi:hypothetical protein
MVEKSITPPDGWRHPHVRGHPGVLRTRDASEDAILLLTLGRALAYATGHFHSITGAGACTPCTPALRGGQKRWRQMAMALGGETWLLAFFGGFPASEALGVAS